MTNLHAEWRGGATGARVVAGSGEVRFLSFPQVTCSSTLHKYRMHAHTHALMHAFTHMRARTHAHMHAHMHTFMFAYIITSVCVRACVGAWP